jgi:hypothetical protein
MEDENLEKYLRTFRPVAPAHLPSVAPVFGGRRSLLFRSWAALAAVVLVSTALMTRWHSKPSPSIGGHRGMDQGEILSPPHALTMGEANSLLAHAPSDKVAVDAIAIQAFRSQSIPLTKGTHSALVVLSKEKTKL